VALVTAAAFRLQDQRSPSPTSIPRNQARPEAAERCICSAQSNGDIRYFPTASFVNNAVTPASSTNAIIYDGGGFSSRLAANGF